MSDNTIDTAAISSPAALRIPSELRRNRPFLLMLASTVVSTLGDWGGFLAIIALTSEIMGPTRSAAFAVSGVMVARVLPSLLIGPVAGVFVDRWNRKRVLVFTHVARGMVLALIPFTNEVLTLVLATLVIELMAALFAPAKDAVFPNLVRPESLVQANQLNLIATYGTLPVGALLYTGMLYVAGLMAGAVPFLEERAVALPLWFNAFTFWVAALLMVGLPAKMMTKRVTPVTAGAWEQFKEGLYFLGTEPVIRIFIVGVMVASAGAGVVITAGEFFARLLNAGPGGYGVLVTLVGVGLVAGFMVARPLTERLQAERVFAPGLGIAGLGLTFTALAPNLAVAATPAVVMGAGAGMVFVVGYTVLQRRASDRLRGRIFGAFNSGVRLAIFGSAVAVPFMIGVLGRERRIPVESASGIIELLYPYSFGGVRITVLGAGLFSVVGAFVVGSVVERTLTAERLANGSAVVADAAVTPGVFIVFEGGDGAGKSTQVALLAKVLQQDGRQVLVTREPGGTALGESLRRVLLTHDGAVPSARAEALLYAAARAQHVEEVIVPALAHGMIVLSDRFVDSSIAYQGSGRGLGDDAVWAVNQFAIGSVQPDLVVLLDTDPTVGLARVVADNGVADRIEAAGLTFHQATRQAFLRRADADPSRYLVLDASASVESLHAAIVARVRTVCPQVGARRLNAAR